MFELKNGTKRIVAAIASCIDDQTAVQQMARPLRYIPEQLNQDMKALQIYHETNEPWSNAAATGYAIAAAQAAGLTHKQVLKIVDAMQAAFENMSLDEAEEVYTDSDF